MEDLPEDRMIPSRPWKFGEKAHRDKKVINVAYDLQNNPGNEYRHS